MDIVVDYGENNSKILDLFFSDDSQFQKIINSDIDFNENNLFNSIIRLVDTMLKNKMKTGTISSQEILEIVNICQAYTHRNNIRMSFHDFNSFINFVGNISKALSNTTRRNILIFVSHRKIIIDYDLDKIFDKIHIILDNGARPIQYFNIGDNNELNRLLYVYASDNIKPFFHCDIRNQNYFYETKTAS